MRRSYMGNPDMVSERWPHSAWWCFNLIDYPLHSDRGDLMVGVGSLFHKFPSALQRLAAAFFFYEVPGSLPSGVCPWWCVGIQILRSGHIPTYALVYIRLEEGNFHIS